MNEQIKISVNGRVLYAHKGMRLSHVLDIEKPCGGHGKCGKCKVIAKGELSSPTEEEKRLLSREELERGVRLSCLACVLGECEIATLSLENRVQIVTEGDLPELEIAPSFKQYGVAVDIGTTTLAARLYDPEGHVLGSASRLNPQQEWGADVISRIEAALNGKARELTTAIRKAVDEVIAELSSAAGINSQEIDGAVITGNTVMLSLLAEESVEPFSHAPFDAKRLFGEALTARKLELTALEPETVVYLPPCISAFVGADTTCAVLATRLDRNDTAMLADIGTNGEIALWHNGRLTVCSTAAGPAFEGVGISMGMRCGKGAIDKVSIDSGVIRAHVIGETAPIGICGSGLVDAIACMLELGILDESGYLEDDEFIIQAPVCITPKDVRMLQLAKSAICAGVVTLARSEGLKMSDLPNLYIAGGFGKYLSVESAAKIGLLPCSIAPRSQAVGNAALAGASAMLLNLKTRKEIVGLIKSAKTLDLSTNSVFSDLYVSGMMLTQVD